jgi:steroid delta-isomerase-like uncharacterized protein
MATIFVARSFSKCLSRHPLTTSKFIKLNGATITSSRPRSRSIANSASSKDGSVMKTSPAEMKRIVTSFYNDIWNVFSLTPVESLLAPDVTFRGTLHSCDTDREGFKRYVLEVGAAFPDFYQEIKELVIDVDGQRCVARMQWSGTHTSEFRGVKPTGKKFEYSGFATFRIKDGKIAKVLAIGDTWGMWKVILGLEATT